MPMKTPVRHRRAWAVTAGAHSAAFGVATCCATPAHTRGMQALLWLALPLLLGAIFVP
jgi:hypothetical protein